MTNAEIAKALQNLKPDSEWSLIGDDYADLVWLSKGNPPTLVDLEAEIALLPTKEKAKADKAAAEKTALFAKLGITADEAKLLLS